MPDFDEAGRQQMKKVAVNELDGIQCHHLLLITVGRISPAKTYVAILTADQPATGEGDPMCVASEILQNVFGTAEWASGIHNPIDSLEISQQAAEFGGLAQVAARQGVIGGNILDFVCVMEACSLRNAALLIHRWSHPVNTIAKCTIRVRNLPGGRTRNLRSG
jgi:hypothetical protein